MFTDENNNAAYDSPAETLLQVHETMGNSITAAGNGNVANYISYTASGQSQLTNGSFQAGTIHICDDRTEDIGKDLVMSSSGRVRSNTGVTCP